LNRKSFLSVGALFMGLIVILGAIGIVNGLWSKNLVINGTVETGDLNADWDCAWTNDDAVTTDNCAGTANDEPITDDGLDVAPTDSDFVATPGFIYTNPFVKKDVGRCTVDIDPDDAGTEFDAQWARVSIENAYPSYQCTIVLALSNTGSIPFNIIGIGTNLGSNGDGIEFLDANGDAAGVCVLPATGTQVDPPTDVAASNEQIVKCTVHVKETAWQSENCDYVGFDAARPGYLPSKVFSCDTEQTYHFVLNACVAQWNEDPSTGLPLDPAVVPVFDEADLTACKGSGQHEGPDEITPPTPGPKQGPNPGIE
jgi:hypothetical protein